MGAIFVTGGAGLTGANVCRQLIERGDDVRALVRNPDEASALSAIGVDLVQGDNRACENAGVEHRVEDLDYCSDPEAMTAAFGPTLMAIAEAAAGEVRTPRSADNPTSERLGYHPMSLDDGLGLLIPWLRELGKI